MACSYTFPGLRASPQITAAKHCPRVAGSKPSSATDVPGSGIRSALTSLRSPMRSSKRRASKHTTRPISTSAAGDGATADGAPLPTGTPGYLSLIKGSDYEIRLYDSHFVIRTEYDRRDEGFDVLGGYMDGRNEAEARLPAPQPVIMTYFPDGRKTMQLYVPTPKAGGTPPLPTVPGVALEVAGGTAMAVTQFTGYATKEAADAAKQALIEGLRKDGMSVADEDGEFLIAQYGPLFSLSTRFNELLMPFKI